jgi:hypothetical protein
VWRTNEAANPAQLNIHGIASQIVQVIVANASIAGELTLIIRTAAGTVYIHEELTNNATTRRRHARRIHFGAGRITSIVFGHNGIVQATDNQGVVWHFTTNDTSAHRMQSL